jgi:hypothetical protein
MRQSLAKIAFLALTFAEFAAAGNTGGIFGPVVNGGHQSIQYRNAYDPDNHNFNQRLHYQRATSDDVMVRGLVQTKKTPQSTNDLDFFQAELFWQLEDVTPRWQQGFRFDARVGAENRPHQIGINWMHDVTLSPTLLARFLMLGSKQLGSHAQSGVTFQARSSLNYQLTDDWVLSFEVFSNLGTTGKFNGLSNQTQQVGPAIIGNLGKWQLFAGVLSGVTSSSPNNSFRFWLTKQF